MAFTSYSALRTAILDDMADGSVLTKAYSYNGKRHEFRDMKEVRETIDWLDIQISRESHSSAGSAGPSLMRIRRD